MKILKHGSVSSSEQLKDLVQGLRKDGYQFHTTAQVVSDYYLVEIMTIIPSWPEPVAVRFIYTGTPESFKAFIQELDSKHEALLSRRAGMVTERTGVVEKGPVN
jgi:hypothetical protein